ncbi:replication initiator protein RctB domain-containing protein [Photobacterium toruni]|uniref:replication initiator protein RctB domain-containing protein n=1 Tax=Photobacterium toruni TaxID=1935446 RepID=UPI0021105A2D|nr:replication initiator protein RctB domain-containing protein [Photobacterium toruni]
MISFDDELPDLESISSTFKLNKSAINTIQILMDAQQLANEDNVVSVKSISDHFEVTSNSISVKVKKLLQKEVLVEIPFDFESAEHRKQGLIKLYGFNQPLFSELNNPVENTGIESQPTSVWGDRNYTEAYIKKNGCLVRADIKKQRPSVIRPREGISIVEQLLVSPVKRGEIVSRNNNVIFLKDKFGNTKRFIASSASTTRIPYVDDIPILYALYSLTINYHKAHKNIYIQNGVMPVNKTFIYLADIVELLQKTRSGSLDKKIRGSIDAFNNTTFDLSGLTTIQDLRDESLLYKTSRYRIFDSLTPISNREASIDPYNQWLMTHALCYEIVWPQDTFNKLLTDTTLFIYPHQAFSAEPFIFVLYLLLRATVRNHEVNGYISSFRSRVGFSQATDDMFQNVLCKTIKRQQKNSVDGFKIVSNKEKKLHLQLWGYTLNFDFGCMTYTARANAEEVNFWCNIFDKKQSAPTVYNELAGDIALIKTMKTLAKSKHYGLNELDWFSNKRKVGYHTVLFSSGDQDYSLTKYHSENELFKMASTISDNDNTLIHGYVLNTLIEFQADLKFINYESSDIQFDTIRKIHKYIVEEIDETNSLSLTYIVKRLVRCSSLLPFIKSFEVRKAMTEECKEKLQQYF